MRKYLNRTTQFKDVFFSLNFLDIARTTVTLYYVFSAQ